MHITRSRRRIGAPRAATNCAMATFPPNAAMCSGVQPCCFRRCGRAHDVCVSQCQLYAMQCKQDLTRPYVVDSLVHLSWSVGSYGLHTRQRSTTSASVHEGVTSLCSTRGPQHTAGVAVHQCFTDYSCHTATHYTQRVLRGQLGLLRVEIWLSRLAHAVHDQLSQQLPVESSHAAVERRDGEGVQLQSETTTTHIGTCFTLSVGAASSAGWYGSNSFRPSKLPFAAAACSGVVPS